MTIVAGWDVGGAHLKIALVEDGRAVAAEQIVCPLWQGLDKLERALATAAPLATRAGRHAVTMTAELSDLFEDRRVGVDWLIARLTAELGADVRFWMGARGFGSAEEARRHPADVASTNFLATAHLVGNRLNSALLIDTGSTTTDIIPVVAGVPANRGATDAERLATGELVYTGLTRTAVMAVATRGSFRGQQQGLAREYFATMADVRRILGELPADVDQHDTADHRGKSLEESVARFARMFGRDAADGTLEDWRAAAAEIAVRQLESMEEGCRQVLAATPLPAVAPIVAAGIGADVVAALAARLGRPAVSFGEVAGAPEGDVRTWATRCAPAVAVALLLA